jgi:GNAT superfamily N-acetyltransferase
MSEVTIEVAGNARELAQLNAAVQEFHNAHYPDKFKPFNGNAVEAWFDKVLGKPTTHAFVARKGGKAIGYILCFFIESEENPFQYKKSALLIDQLCVEHQHRKQGVASQLMAAAYQLAETHGMEEIRIEHWEANEIARDFFINQGFERYKQCRTRLLKAKN